MTGRARDAYEALTPLGRLLTATVPVVLLLAVALVGMTCRGEAPASIEGAALQYAPFRPQYAPFRPPLAHPIMPPADLARLLRSDVGAGDAERGMSTTRDSLVVEPGGGEGGAGSSAFALSVTPAPEPTANPAWPLSRDAMRSVLVTAEWPEAWVADGVRLACGGPGVTDRAGRPAPSGESGCNPGAVGAAGELGLFQIKPAWASRCGVEPAHLRLPLVNAYCAMRINEIGLAEGRGMWASWSVRP